MARRLTDLNIATTPLDRSEIILIQQGGIDKHTTVQSVLNVDYLNGLFDTRLAIKTTDDLAEGSSSYKKYFFNHGNVNHTETYITSASVNFNVLNTNGSVGEGFEQVSFGNHHHDTVYVRRDGIHPMTGSLEVGSININSVDPGDTATIFGTHSGGNSVMHIRMGNGVGDKFQIESWNGSSATSLLEIGQSTVTIKGNLQVTGTTVSVDSTSVNIADNEIVLNSNITAAPSTDASIVVNRGTSSNSRLTWSESSDRWVANNGTTTSNIALHSEFKSGSSAFHNTPGTAVTVTHGLGTASFRVSVTPTAITNGFLGEWYITNKTTTTFNVTKTGSGTSITFDWTATTI